MMIHMQCRKLKIKLAVTVDGMEPFVKATYALEGDGMLSVTTYETIRTLYTSNHHPNVIAIARQLANGSSTNEQMLVTYSENCVRPVYQY